MADEGDLGNVTANVSPGETAEDPEGVTNAPLPEAPEGVAPLAALEATGDLLFDAMWRKVDEGWDDDKIHAAILEYAVTAERLPDLAGHYRALKDHPTRGERATKRLDAIVIAATQMMMSMKTPATSVVPLPITLSVFGLFIFAVLFVAYAMWHRQ